jgi:hypothetical protein
MKRHDVSRRRQLVSWHTLSMTGVVALAVISSPQIAAASTSDYDVTINTSSLSGQGATLAFDFVAGGTFSNAITISDFSTNGALGPNGPNSGSVTGALPGTVMLTDASFFTEFLQATTLGSTISFQLDATTKGPSAGALPDTFAFFVLNPTASASLLTTTDPTGADSLFSLQIDGTPSGIVSVYSSDPTVSARLVPVSSSVPEPATLGLLLFGLLGVVGRLVRSRG